MSSEKTNAIRPSAESYYADELEALRENDEAPKPTGWRLSPSSVKTFIVGSEGRKIGDTEIKRKFYGDDQMVERAIVSLLGNRGLMLVGEPGTAKSMLSELLAAAICGDSNLTIQGTAGTTEDQIKYSWNYALLLSEGPSLRSLVPGPVFTAMQQGKIVRFEEITRCQPEVQDVLVSLLSEKVLHVPELTHEDSLVQATRGFNIIATANIRDRGVNEMSSALKRRFNFETIRPIADKELEIHLVKKETQRLLSEVELEISMKDDVLDLLITTFQDLRTGRTGEGASIEKPNTTMSTAEAVAVSFSSCLDAYYFNHGKIEGGHIAKQLCGTVFKDDPNDAKKLQHYLNVVAKVRAKKGGVWKQFYEYRDNLA